ncbi:hypothetical protein HYFRA_00005813 [Hymenoscyphus fraxineus]|uniref:Protein-lysine N-methyltransferase EFM5 n=1 Tax=Hymenoscyphus fraxineus TaxID=746836 RepID=A0A9N9KX36_9HELO|nr:hypothetical protein HYFRA_00005813 [Hymenoscyphus fraxineus]
MSSEDDEPLVLSGGALDALKEFYADRDALQKKFEDLKTAAEEEYEDGKEGRKVKVWSMEAFGEDWGVSQFWYSDETATIIAKELLEGATAETQIAAVSAPSVFIQLKNLLNQSPLPPSERPKIWLLEYDKRFEVFANEFVYYDFNNPLKLPPTMKSTISRFIIDPPFLNEDCQTKGTHFPSLFPLTILLSPSHPNPSTNTNNHPAAQSVSYLSKSWSLPAPSPSTSTSTSPDTNPKIIVCTGERMQPLIHKIYAPIGIRTTTFLPVHDKGLSNEFFCYSNFEGEAWKFRSEEEDGDGEKGEKDGKEGESKKE